MTRLQEPNRKAWLWLLNEGGRHTAAEVAQSQDWHVDHAMAQLFSMHRHKLIEKFPPAQGSRRQRYGVTGTCEVPCGITIAEVQA